MVEMMVALLAHLSANVSASEKVIEWVTLKVIVSVTLMVI